MDLPLRSALHKGLRAPKKKERGNFSEAVIFHEIQINGSTTLYEGDTLLHSLTSLKN